MSHSDEIYSPQIPIQEFLKQGIFTPPPTEGLSNKEILAEANALYHCPSRSEKKFRKALSLFQLLINRNEIQGFYALAYAFYEGRCGLKSEESISIFEYLATLNDPKALHALGVCYHMGVGVPQDDKKAIEYFNRAAKENYAAAYLGLALCAKYGEGLPQDPNKAREYILKARDLGSRTASLMFERDFQ